MKTVKFGIIGLGGIAKKFATACGEVESASIVAVASRSLEKAEKFAKEYEVTKAYDDYEALVNDSEVEAVYIAVVNSGHFPAIMMAAKAGKAVLCEKPALSNQAEMDQVMELVKQGNILFMEAMWSLCLPPVLKAKEWVKSGRIGTLKSIDASFSFWAKKQAGSRLFEKDLDGGGLIDVGVYGLAFSDFMAEGKIVDVKAMEYIGDTEVDEYGTMMLRYDNDVIAMCHYGVALHRNNVGYLYGEEGYIEAKRFWDCRTINLYNRDDELVDTYTATFDNGFIYEVEHFCELYLQGKKESEINTRERSLTYVKVYDEVRKQRV